MFKLEIKKQDGSSYWTESFNTKLELDEWLAEEKTRPYWDPEYIYEIIQIANPVVTPIAVDPEKQESIEALNLGMDIIADIRTLNKAKLLAGTLTLTELFADPNIALIERALWLGSLETAKGLIISLQVFYTAEEKAPIIAKIDAHTLKWTV